jgi:hypothetical protein
MSLGPCVSPLPVTVCDAVSTAIIPTGSSSRKTKLPCARLIQNAGHGGSIWPFWTKGHLNPGLQLFPSPSLLL